MGIYLKSIINAIILFDIKYMLDVKYLNLCIKIYKPTQSVISVFFGDWFDEIKSNLQVQTC